MLEELNLLHLTGLITLVWLMWKLMGLFSVYLLRCWDCLSFLDWIRALTWSLLLELPPRKLEFWFNLFSIYLLSLFSMYISVLTWICWINYRSKYVGLLVIHLVPLLNPWIIVKVLQLESEDSQYEDPTSLRVPGDLRIEILETRWLASGEWGHPLGSDPKLPVV